jgi:hypothetical protein
MRFAAFSPSGVFSFWRFSDWPRKAKEPVVREDMTVEWWLGAWVKWHTVNSGQAASVLCVVAYAINIGRLQEKVKQNSNFCEQ